MSENMASRAPLNPDEVAKSLYLQQVEQATDLRPFLNEMERVMKSSSSDSDDESSSDGEPRPKVRKSRGDRLVNGVMTTKEGKIIEILTFNTYLRNKMTYVQVISHYLQFVACSL